MQITEMYLIYTYYLILEGQYSNFCGVQILFVHLNTTKARGPTRRVPEKKEKIYSLPTNFFLNFLNSEKSWQISFIRTFFPCRERGPHCFYPGPNVALSRRCGWGQSKQQPILDTICYTTITKSVLNIMYKKEHFKIFTIRKYNEKRSHKTDTSYFLPIENEKQLFLYTRRVN